MRSLTVLLLLAALASAPTALAATRVVAYCDSFATPTCGLSVGDRDDDCGPDLVAPCAYTTGGAVGAGARFGADSALCDDIPYCFDAHVAPSESCIGDETAYVAGHNAVYEGGDSYCANRSNAPCDSLRDVVLRILSEDHVVPAAQTCRTLIGYP